MSMEKRLSREEEERLWIISVVPLIPFLIIFGVYLAHLKSIGAISSSFEDMFTYVMIAVMLHLVASFGIYEFVSSFKVKQSPSFKIKRWLSRTVFASTCILCWYALWSLFILLFSSILKTQYILILSTLVLMFLLLAFLHNPKTRRLVKKLTQEEN